MKEIHRVTLHFPRLSITCHDVEIPTTLHTGPDDAQALLERHLVELAAIERKKGRTPPYVSAWETQNPDPAAAAK